jgi:hypothetical protein
LSGRLDLDRVSRFRFGVERPRKARDFAAHPWFESERGGRRASGVGKCRRSLRARIFVVWTQRC